MLSRLFGRATFLDADVEDWLLASWALLDQRLGGGGGLADTPVVLPTREFFPPSHAEGHARAEHVFACVRRAMGMDDNWPCRLEPQPVRATGQRVAEFVAIQGDSDPNGTFRVTPEGGVVITYAPDLLDNPTALVATLAHELAHYLLLGEPDIHAEEDHELTTDLVVAYTGFGVFGANSAFAFEQHGDAFSQGWSSRSSGYLSPRSWAFALAVFSELRGADGGMEPFLKPEIAGLRRKAIAYLRKTPSLLEGLRAGA